MSIELSILKQFCLSRSIFEKYNPYIVREHALDREIKVLFYVVQNYYEKYEKNFISKQDLISMHKYMYTNSKDAHMYMEIIDHMYSLDVNPDLVMDNIEKLMEKQTANDIINLLAPIIEGDEYNRIHEAQEMLDEYVKKLRNPPQETLDLEYWDGKISELVDDVYNVRGYRWPKDLPFLNNTLGVIHGGMLGCIFAYSDVGKSSFGQRLAAAIALQMEREGLDDTCIAYCCNEEGRKRVLYRMLCAIVKRHRNTVAGNWNHYGGYAIKYGFRRIKTFDSVTHIKNVEKILDKLRPRVMLIDQGTKVSCGNGPASGEVKDLQILFNVYRELAKQYNCAIICLAQAVGTASNKKVLTLDHIYGSRVAIQGELDFAIGIGSRDEPEYEKSRWLNVCKNKLKNGDKGMVHVTFEKDTVEFVQGKGS